MFVSWSLINTMQVQYVRIPEVCSYAGRARPPTSRTGEPVKSKLQT